MQYDIRELEALALETLDEYENPDEDAVATRRERGRGYPIIDDEQLRSLAWIAKTIEGN